MSSRRQFHREKDVHVGVSECNCSHNKIQEYVPDGRKRSPAKSMPSNSQEQRPMDEISLLKRGLIKGGHHNLRSGKPIHENVAPITLQELTSRGVILDNGKIIYSLPGQGLPGRELSLPSNSDSNQWSEGSVSGSGKSTSTSTSGMTGLSSLMAQHSFIEPPLNSSKFQVGLPQEKAFLRMSNTEHGMRYELNVGDDFHLLLMDTDKTSSITICKGL